MITVAQKNAKIAKKLMAKFFFKTDRDSNVIYIYNDKRGVYTTGAESYIRESVQWELKEDTTKHAVSEIVDYIARSTITREGEEFDSNPDLLVVGNGVLNVITKQLAPHNPSYLAMRSVAVDYDPLAECPLTRLTLAQLLTEDDYDQIVKFLGYLLIPDNRYKRALALVGPRNTGKTTLLSLFLNLLGVSNVAMEKIQRLCDANFSEFELVGKMANVRDDIDAATIDNAEKIKELTGDFVATKVEQKYVQRRTTFRNRAKLIFTTNLMPLPKRPDPVYFGRWVIVEMRRQFHFGASTDADSRAIVDLKGKLSEELSGVLNLALVGREMLVKDNGFREYDDEMATYRYLAYAGNNAGRFLTNRVCVDPDGAITKGVLYGLYQGFCRLQGEPYQDANELAKMLKAVFPMVINGWVGNSKAWRGISVREDDKAGYVPRFQYGGVSIKPSDMVDCDNDERNY